MCRKYEGYSKAKNLSSFVNSRMDATQKVANVLQQFQYSLIMKWVRINFRPGQGISNYASHETQLEPYCGTWRLRHLIGLRWRVKRGTTLIRQLLICLAIWRRCEWWSQFLERDQCWPHLPGLWHPCDHRSHYRRSRRCAPHISSPAHIWFLVLDYLV